MSQILERLSRYAVPLALGVAGVQASMYNGASTLSSASRVLLLPSARLHVADAWCFFRRECLPAARQGLETGAGDSCRPACSCPLSRPELRPPANHDLVALSETANYIHK